MPSIARYMRVSTSTQEIKIQRDAIDKYCTYSFPDGVFVDYVDEGLSGKDMHRAEMQRLKDDILNLKIDTVVAYKLDRLGRSLSDLLILFNFFEKNAVTVHLVADKIDTSTPSGRLLFHVTGAFSEFERSIINERLQAGREYARLHGTRSGKPLHRPRKEINFRECLDLYKKGLSISKLSKYFKINPATMRKRLQERGVL